MLIRLNALCACVGLAMVGIALTETTTTTTQVPLSPEVRAANALCRTGCTSAYCYMPDPDDCRMFTMCDKLEETAGGQNQYYATRMHCAHGTMWAGKEQEIKITCDYPSNVKCTNNFCAGKPIGFKYQSSKKDCKTYWECGDDGPMAKCCGANEKFALRVDSTYECVRDNMNECTMECPDKKHACKTSPVDTASLEEDGNCRSYWDCVDPNAPHPVCCPANSRYDSSIGDCREDPTCTTPCDYTKNMCSGIPGHALNDDTYCRTYMKCGTTRLEDKLWCCPPESKFSEQTLKCEQMTAAEMFNCSNHCPVGYSSDCNLRPDATNSSMYEQYVGTSWMLRKCAPGTFFDGVNSCGCGTIDPQALDHACSLAFNIQYDGSQNASKMIRSGSESKADINLVGEGSLKAGQLINGSPSVMFDQSLFNEIPYFKQGLPNFFLKMLYFPTSESGTAKYVLLSNCEGEGSGANKVPPSLEVSTQGDQLSLLFQTDKNITNVKLRFKDNVWNKLEIIYTGQAVYASNAASGETARTFASAAITGTIVTPSKPLSIGGCVGDKTNGYKGSIAKVEIAKCLTQIWVDEFNLNMAQAPTVFSAN